MSTIQLSRVKETQAGAQLSTASQQNRTTNRRIVCCYTNYSEQFQIVRIATPADGSASNGFERLVLPHAKVLFEADWCDRLEVHTGRPITSIPSDTIPCYQLTYSQTS